MIDTAGLEIQWTGNPVGGGAAGGFQTEGSIQYDPANNPNATFVNIAAPAYAPAIVNPTGVSNPPSQLVAFSPTQALPFRYLRLRYTNASGAGVLDVWVNQTGAS